jgi:hypothetical protein
MRSISVGLDSGLNPATGQASLKHPNRRHYLPLGLSQNRLHAQAHAGGGSGSRTGMRWNLASWHIEFEARRSQSPEAGCLHPPRANEPSLQVLAAGDWLVQLNLITLENRKN